MKMELNKMAMWKWTFNTNQLFGYLMEIGVESSPFSSTWCCAKHQQGRKVAHGQAHANAKQSVDVDVEGRSRGLGKQETGDHRTSTAVVTSTTKKQKMLFKCQGQGSETKKKRSSGMTPTQISGESKETKAEPTTMRLCFWGQTSSWAANTRCSNWHDQISIRIRTANIKRAPLSELESALLLVEHVRPKHVTDLLVHMLPTQTC